MLHRCTDTLFDLILHKIVIRYIEGAGSAKEIIYRQQKGQRNNATGGVKHTIVKPVSCVERNEQKEFSQRMETERTP
jgi:hypothetical protein